MSLRRCLREPIPEIEVAATRLSDAAAAHLRGDREETEALLRQADDGVVRDWLNSVWGKETEYNRRRRVLAEPAALPMNE